MKKSTKETSFIDLMQRIQKQNRFVGDAYGLQLSLLESHLLTEISEQPGITPGSLAKILLIEPARISVPLRELRKKKLISVIKDTKDKRSAGVSLTAPGTKLIQNQDDVANELLEKFSFQLTKSEIHSFHKYLHQLCDQWNVPPSKIRKGEHPIRSANRRITRYFQLLGTSVFDSGLSSLNWNILAEIDRSPGATPTFLSVELSSSLGTIGQCLVALFKQKLIKKIPSHKDSRSYFLILTESGKNLLKTLNTKVQQEFERAHQTIPTQLLNEGITLYHRFVTSCERSLYEEHLKGFSVKKITDNHGLHTLRARFLEEVYKEGRLQEVGDIIFSPANCDQYLITHPKIKGSFVAETDRKSSTLVHAAWIYEKEISPALKKGLIVKLAEAVHLKDPQGLQLLEAYHLCGSRGAFIADSEIHHW